MTHYHAAVWIDHAEARVFSLTRDAAKEWTIHPHDRHVHLHHKAGKGDSGRAPTDKHYFQGVAEAIRDAAEILIVGPGSARHELATYLREHAPDTAKKIVGVEPLDHPTDGELVKFARKFFKAVDRMQPFGSPSAAAG